MGVFIFLPSKENDRICVILCVCVEKETQNPQPHISIAWTLGNLKAEIESAVRDILFEDGDSGQGFDDKAHCHPAPSGECDDPDADPRQSLVQRDGDYTYVKLPRACDLSIRFWRIVALAGHKVIPLWS